MLQRNLDTVAVADVYKLFVFDAESLATDEQPELMSLAREFGNRIGDGARMSEAKLFETGVAARD